MAAESAAAKGREFEAEAKKKLGGFALFNKAQKYEDAAELFSKAGAQYKIAKEWQLAGEAYKKAAENSEKCGNDPEALNFYTQAAKALKNSSPLDCVQLLQFIVDKQQANGKFSIAAKLYKEIAEIYESEMKYPQSIKAYESAADCFKTEDAVTSAHQCMLKVADFSAQMEDYKKAIEIYEQVAEASVDNNLTKWSVSQYLFKAALCHLAEDSKLSNSSGTQVALDKYKDMHAQFETSREYGLLNKCCAAYDEADADKFTEAVFDYDQISKLDAWKSSILLKVKQSIQKGDNPLDKSNEPNWG